MKLQEKFSELQQKKSALLATNFYNYETLKGILLAASGLNVPIILQITEKSINYLGLDIATKMARSALDQFEVEGWLHLDHADSYDLVARCLDAGFDSVMMDASDKPFKDNIALTKKVVDKAQNYQANVEAELGYIAKLGQSKEKVGFTDPDEAKIFVDETGISALAVAIGTSHGFYTKEPNLDIERLKSIHKLIPDIALVLHGGSGVPNEQLKKAISEGIVKINFATEIKNMFMGELKRALNKTEEIDLRIVFPEAIASVEKLVGDKLKVVTV